MPVAEREQELCQALVRRIHEARANTDRLFSLVRPDSLYERPIAERHRIVFYIGHLEAFDWNLLRERLLGLPAFHPEFDRLFAFGIDPVGGGLPNDQREDWPTLEHVREYVVRARQTLDHNLEAGLAEAVQDESKASAGLLLQVAIEHRLMHAETLAYLLHQLPLDRKLRPQMPSRVLAPPVTPEMVDIPAGKATLGLPRDKSDRFGWDNEFEEHTEGVPAFAIDKYKVTNGQYLEFLAADGYDNRSLWTTEGWTWKTERNTRHPGFWRCRGDAWYLMTMFDEIPLPFDWPVYVSQAEASAYARWAGKALPRESEWHRAVYGAPNGSERPYPWGREAPSARRGNFDFQQWDPVSVAAFPDGDSAFGVADAVGNGWEWTSTVFGPFPGFEAFPFYPGYSADFFDSKHFVMKGASPRTAACMLRHSFRNWFQPHYPHVYAGFRCVSH